MSRDHHRTRSLVATTALAPLTWGTTYFVTTELLAEGRPLTTAALRALPVGIVFVAATRRLPSGDWWWRAAVLGALNIGVFFALLFVAAYRLPGGIAATAGALQPLVAAVLASRLASEPLRARTTAASVLGVAGVGLLVLRSDASLDRIGLAASAIGTVSMATGVVLTKRWGRPVGHIAFTGWQLVVGGVLLLPAAIVVEGPPDSPSATNIVGYVWLASIGTGLAYITWFRGIERLPVVTVSALGLLSPLAATVLGWLLLAQRLAAAQAVGALMVAAAVALAAGSERPRRSGARSALARATIIDI
jgi:probable blue pigment (indigoidine) exporter